MILTKKELAKIVSRRRHEGDVCVLTNGCFDILHPGHMDNLKRCREMGDYLVVGLNSDASIKRIKGEKRPIFSQEHRAIMLDNLKWVNYVVIFEEDTAIDLIETIDPDIYVKGGTVYNTFPEKEYGEKNNIEIVVTPLVEGISSSDIISRIVSRYGNSPLNPQRTAVQ